MTNHMQHTILQIKHWQPINAQKIRKVLSYFFFILSFRNIDNIFIQEVITRQAKETEFKNLPARLTNPSSPILHESRFKLSNFVNPAWKKINQFVRSNHPLSSILQIFIVPYKNDLLFFLLFVTSVNYTGIFWTMKLIVSVQNKLCL